MLLLWQVVAFLSSGSGTSGTCTLPYGMFYQQLQAGQVKDVTIQGDQATGDLKQPITCPTGNNTTTASFQTTIPTNDQTLLAQLDTQVRTTGLRYTVQSSSGNVWLSLLINLLPWLLFGGLIFFFLRRAGRTQQNVFGFGKSRAKLMTGDRPSTTFADVAGVEEAKAELQEVVEFLKTPEKFQRPGRQDAQGRAAGWPAGHGQDAAGAGGRWGGGGAVLLDLRLRVCRDVGRGGRLAGARSV